MTSQLAVMTDSTMFYVDNGEPVGQPGWKFYHHPCIKAVPGEIAILLEEPKTFIDGAQCVLQHVLLVKNDTLFIGYLCYRILTGMRVYEVIDDVDQRVLR